MQNNNKIVRFCLLVFPYRFLSYLISAAFNLQISACVHVLIPQFIDVCTSIVCSNVQTGNGLQECQPVEAESIIGLTVRM
jgi:hypothetical protein